jgi:hypothetical protein
VTGDAAQVDHFVADIILIRPDLPVPFVESSSQPLILPASARSASYLSFILNADMPTFDQASRSYRAIRIAIVPTDPMLGCDPAFSPAFPRLASDPATHSQVAHNYVYEPFGGVPVILPVSFGGEPGPGLVSAWVEGQTDSHSGIVFAGFSPRQHHIGVRPAHDGDHLMVEVTGELQGKYRLIAFIGFQGGLEFPSSVTVDTSCRVYELANPANFADYTPPAVNFDSDPNLSPTPMAPIVIDIDTLGDVGPGQMGLMTRFHINCVHVDPAHPPILTGIRLLQAP